MEGEQNNVNVGMGEGAGGSSSGPVIGAIVILGIVILGSLYFWTQRTSIEPMVGDNSIQTGTDDAAATIEADLNAIDIESLDAELNAS